MLLPRRDFNRRFAFFNGESVFAVELACTVAIYFTIRRWQRGRTVSAGKQLRRFVIANAVEVRDGEKNGQVISCFEIGWLADALSERQFEEKRQSDAGPDAADGHADDFLLNALQISQRQRRRLNFVYVRKLARAELAIHARLVQSLGVIFVLELLLLLFSLQRKIRSFDIVNEAGVRLDLVKLLSQGCDARFQSGHARIFLGEIDNGSARHFRILIS